MTTPTRVGTGSGGKMRRISNSFYETCLECKVFCFSHRSYTPLCALDAMFGGGCVMISDWERLG